MGEIAEAMLDGVLCEGCGAYLGEGAGHPRRCGECTFKAFNVQHGFDRERIRRPFRCNQCGKRFSRQGSLVQHKAATGHYKKECK